jgi:DNA-directed RNA polymerase specialized sigma24 family protein
MSDISEEEKLHHIKTSFEVDTIYLRALEDLRQELIAQGIDIDSGEGRKIFIRAVRKLNERFV